MRKKIIIIVAMAASTCLIFTGCSTKKMENKAETVVPTEMSRDLDENETTTSAEIPNPFVEYSSLGDAEKAAGFEINIPDFSYYKSFTGSDKHMIRVMDGRMIEIIFEDEDGNECFRIRKAKGNEDISGDYNQYSETKTETVNGKDIRMSGNDGTVSVATWESDGYSYALDMKALPEPATADTVVSLAGPVD